MRVSLGLPTHRVDRVEEFVSGGAVAELATAAEAAGFDAMFTSDHPAPPVAWLAAGGHHTVDPFVVLATAAAVTTRLRLHTNLFVPAYRQPLIAAKLVASLDRMSGGRLILGVGAGYVKAEFAAVGADFDGRNSRLDEAIGIMRRAWTGEPVDDVVQLPRPVQPAGPPVWIGGNSTRAMRRAVELGEGWNPMPSPARAAKMLRTPGLESVADLQSRIDALREMAAASGRDLDEQPLDIAFMPAGLDMFNAAPVDPQRVLAEMQELAAAGVTWATVMLPGETRPELLRAIERFGAEVLPKMPGA